MFYRLTVHDSRVFSDIFGFFPKSEMGTKIGTSPAVTNLRKRVSPSDHFHFPLRMIRALGCLSLSASEERPSLTLRLGQCEAHRWRSGSDNAKVRTSAPPSALHLL